MLNYCLLTGSPLTGGYLKSGLLYTFWYVMISIGNEMRLKNSVGEECVMKFLRSREGFYRVCSIDDLASEYAPLIGAQGLRFRFCPVIS